MDTTIGKRIAKYRKGLGLTQDQLAEKIGITAQAVSKWENDLSCPDITILPKLADIFDTSTDMLLGRETATTVTTAEIISNTDKRDSGFSYDSDSGNMDFHWEGAKLEGVGLACWVLCAGVVYLIARLLSIDISFWNVLWPTFLLTFGLFGLYPKFSVLRLGCGLCGAYFLLDKLGILSVELDSGILIAVLVVMFGLALLADALKKRKHPWQKAYTGNGKYTKFCNDYRIDGNTFYYDASFGDSQQIVLLETLGSGEISVNFGDFTVDLSSITALEPSCNLHADCNFGQLSIRIPRCFQVCSASSTAFAGFEIRGQADPTPKGTIHLDADVSFGSIVVYYI